MKKEKSFKTIRIKVFCPNCGEIVICFPRSGQDEIYEGDCEERECKSHVVVENFSEEMDKVKILITYY